MLKISTTFLVLILIGLFGFVLAWPIQFIWNNVLTKAVDGINTINIYQSYGLFLLFHLLFPNNLKINNKI
jgi:hypothetical protein